MRARIEDYLAQGQAGGWAPATVATRRYVLRHAAAFLRARGLGAITDVKPADLEACLAGMKRKGNKRATIAARAQVIASFFAWLARNGKLLANPAQNLRAGSRGDEALPEPPLEEADVARLIEQLPRRNAVHLRNILAVELLYSLGLRRSEALALDLKDMDTAGALALIRRGKGGNSRALPLPRGVRHALLDYLALRRSMLKGPDHGALLLNQNGKRMNAGNLNGFFQNLNRWRARRGLRRVHPHLLRHSIAVHLLRGGADVRHVQAFLGHAHLDTTKTYLRLVASDLREAYDEAMPELLLDAR